MTEAVTAIDPVKNELLAWSEMLRNETLTALAFAKEQIPGVLQEYLKYRLIFHATWVIIALSICIAGCGLARAGFLQQVAYKAAYNTYRQSYGGSITNLPPDGEIITGVGICAAVLGFSTTLINLFSVIKITVAPRVVLLEYITRLLN